MAQQSIARSNLARNRRKRTNVWACAALIALTSLSAITFALGQDAVTLALPAPQIYLALARASGFAAYGLLWLAMALGITITNRLARIWPGGPAAYALHRYASLLGLAVTLMHVLALLGDPALGYSLAGALLPLAGAGYRSPWVGLLGKVGLYLMAGISLSFYVRARLGQRLWRIVHGLSFIAFLLALAHGLAAGSDSSAPWAAGMYSVSAGVLVMLTLYRLWVMF